MFAKVYGSFVNIMEGLEINTVTFGEFAHVYAGFYSKIMIDSNYVLDRDKMETEALEKTVTHFKKLKENVNSN